MSLQTRLKQNWKPIQSFKIEDLTFML